jgi:outer membrane protein TolC
MSLFSSRRPTRCCGRVLVAAATLSVAAGTNLPGQAARDVRSASTDTVALTFDGAVMRALRDGDEVRAATAQVAVADAQIGIARSTGLPQLRLNSGYTQVVENARAAIVGAVFGQAFTYNTNAQLQQPLFLGGRVVAGARAAGAVRSAARATTAEVRAQVVVERPLHTTTHRHSAAQPATRR